MSNTEAQRQFREAGGVDTILNVLSIHQENAVLVKSAVNAIYALAQDETNRELFIEAGAIEKINEISYKHVGDEEVLRVCLNAMLALDPNTISNANPSEETKV